jgi:hypothetical protein
MTIKSKRPWPEKRRAAQAARCKAAKPSRHASGPKTPEGKAASSRNAHKHGLYAADVLNLRALLREQARFVLAIRSDLA